MKKRRFFGFTFVLVFALFLSNSFAEDLPHTILEGHTGDVYAIAFSPDGSTLASRSQDNTIRLWDVSTGAHKHTLEGHTDNGIPTADVTAIAFSPAGSILASGSADNTIRLWDAATGAHKHTLEGHTEAVTAIAFSPDGMLASGSADNTIRLWDAATGTHKHTLEGHTEAVTAIAFSPDGSILASGSADNTIRLWDAATGTHKRTLEGHIQAIYAIAFSPDGSTLASRSARWDNTIRLWDVSTGTHKALEGHIGDVFAIAFNPDGSILASGGWDETIRLWDAATGAHKHTLEGHTQDVYTLAFSPDGSILASGSDDNTIRLWDAATGEREYLLEGHTNDVTAIAFSPDGSILASGSADNTICLWELPSTYVSITPAVVESPAVGEQLVINVSIAGGKDVRGYRVTVRFEGSLKYVSHTHGDYLPDNAFIGPTVINPRYVSLNIASPAGVGNGDGTLATITFEVVIQKASHLTLSVILSDSNGERLFPFVNHARVIEPWDVNGDGSVDILDLSFVASRLGQTGQAQADVNSDGVIDIKDLVLVASAVSYDAVAPAAHPQAIATITPPDVHGWISQAQRLDLTEVRLQRGLFFLEQLLAALVPKETALLPNYPNPFNPETWIPYRLAEDTSVSLTIYDGSGQVVRTLDVGHRVAAFYESRSKAIYWDGRNNLGETVASGAYFYYLSAGDYSATRKMLILK